MNEDQIPGIESPVVQSTIGEPSAAGWETSSNAPVETSGEPLFESQAQEAVFQVARAENYTIWANAWGQNGGNACSDAPYWRYRIQIPNFDTSRQRDRRLVVTPRAQLNGYSELAEQPPRSSAQAILRFWTGVWHHRYTGNGYNSNWSGWRRSYDVIRRDTVGASTRQTITVGSPGLVVSTPMVHDPPGRITQPNPINNYGLVRPNDIIDLYVNPQVCATTAGSPSSARIDYSFIDVPAVTVGLETGYIL